MVRTHNLGFPRIGVARELKKSLEAYWRKEVDEDSLRDTGRALRQRHWRLQHDKGLDLLPVGDFSYYDQVLDMTTMLGAIPERFGWLTTGSPDAAELTWSPEVDIDLYFRMARGRAPSGAAVEACEMTKWFDTNYHFLVPELRHDQQFQLSSTRLFDELDEAQRQGVSTKPVLIGPLTWLWLGKVKGRDFDRLSLLERVLPVYQTILQRLKSRGVNWIQIDEPILVLDLPEAWRAAFKTTYASLAKADVNCLLATYFGALEDNLELVCDLPVAGIHLDAVRGGDEILAAAQLLSKAGSADGKILSAGIVDGRNVWRTDLDAALTRLYPLHALLGERLWLAPSCSLLHVPVDLEGELAMDAEVRGWLAFACQKIDEVVALGRALNAGVRTRDGRLGTEHRRPAGESGLAENPTLTALFAQARSARQSRDASTRVHRPEVGKRLAGVAEEHIQRHSAYAERARSQQARLKLPLFPTTTIGSFPQTPAIRGVRRQLKQGEIKPEVYVQAIKEEIAQCIREQEAVGLDVLVHGEAERNDMVEYFGELLDGFLFTANGWVQSYGSRCVKPPIIIGDVSRPTPMTVAWIRYAQSLTDKPVKGMLTGPVTILNWSFVRDDQPRSETCLQIALAIRDEVRDLEAAGINVIQIDEAALREGLPLRRRHWQAYLAWTVRAFRVAASGVRDDTQIHTHMCYSEFNDIIEAVAAMDADVITIESSRSDMRLLKAFEDFSYPSQIGPGVYDIHSPNVPSAAEIAARMDKAVALIAPQQLWINPDCGLKTRTWDEVKPALINLVGAAEQMRASYFKRGE